MAVAVSSAFRNDGTPKYNVIGLDLPNDRGRKIVKSFNSGKFPFETTDTKLIENFANSISRKNLVAGTDPELLSLAEVIIVDINLDLVNKNGKPDVELEKFLKGIRTIGKYVSRDTLVIIETTVPPGTTEKIVVPEIRKILKTRGLAEDSVFVAHSYERVMPGSEYFDSIVNYWRVYSGYTQEASKRCKEFLSSIINVNDYPLTELSSTTASETAKVLENSYRAVNIAFMEEWGRFAEEVGVNMFEIIEAIRKRPTHSNIRQPGFGVGGYCLTKDPLFAKISAEKIFNKNVDFKFSTKAVEVNKKMPLAVLDKMKSHFEEGLKNKNILLCGVSYRQDVGDTRNSPSEIFVNSLRQLGAKVICYDPLVNYWEEMGENVLNSLPESNQFNAVVFAVPHKEFKRIIFSEWLANNKILIIDANNVLNYSQIKQIRMNGNKLLFIGRGDLV